MGQGTSAPPAAPAVQPAANSPGSGMSPQQMQAVAALLGQMGKRSPMASGMQGQVARPMPQVSTVQGGTYFNPNQQR